MIAAPSGAAFVYVYKRTGSCEVHLDHERDQAATTDSLEERLVPCTLNTNNASRESSNCTITGTDPRR